MAAVAVTVTGVAAVNATETSTTVAAPQIKSKNRKTASAAAGAVLPCPGARTALTYYRAAYARHRAAQRLPGPVPFVRYDCPSTQRRAIEWRDRATIERLVAEGWRDFHFDWSEWLPRTWYVVGRCETGYGGAPRFTHQNGSFVSAFGISRREYNRDAAHMGAPPWPSYAEQADGVPLPTPREQLLAAIGHYRRFGDGWTCPGPAGSGAASYGIETSYP